MTNKYTLLKRNKLRLKKTSSRKGVKKSIVKPPVVTPPAKKKSSGGGGPRVQSLQKKSLNYGSMSMVVDATRDCHIPPPLPLGPYTVVRGRVTMFLNSDATGGHYNALLISPHGITGSRDVAVTPVVAIQGLGNGVPGLNETLTNDALISAYSAPMALTVASGQLHGLTVTVNCLSPCTAAEGQMFIGSLNQRINRSRFVTWNALAQSVINRREMAAHSAYSILSDPLKLSCYPVDITNWASQVPICPSSPTLSDNYTLDSLSQIAIVLPPTNSSITYSITIYTEWRVNFTDPALASTATTHAASDMGVWSQIAAAGSTTAGFLSGVETAVSSGLQALGALRGASSAASNLTSTLGLFL